MRLRDAVLKHSLGRTFLHRLSSTYFVELNHRALEEIERSLSHPEVEGPGRALVDRLARQGLVEDGEFVGLPHRRGSDLISLEVEPVGSCNLACRHCFVHFTEATLSEEAFDALLNGAVVLGAVELTFNGGEPLLHPRCLDWIDQVRAHGIRTLLFTNGTLVTEKIAERLGRSGLARVTVSLDGFEAAHDAIRGAGSFDKTTRGIERLVKAGL